MTDRSWFERVPKVELHLHLEGAIPHSVLWQLVQKYGGDPAVHDIAALEARFHYRDFPHFIDTWVRKNRFLREYEDYTLISEAMARDLVHQNTRYAEVFYSPARALALGLNTQRLTEAIRSGLSKVPETEVALVCDFVRDLGPESAERTLSELDEVQRCGVVGVTIGGSEQDYPPEPFAAVYERARRLGFHTSAHAGEAAGPQSVWGAIRSLGVERIGHGTRSVEDAALIDHLAESRIPLEVCPLSNLRTGVVRSIDVHPVRTFFERGVVVTISTDDPRMFGNTLAEEYRLLVDKKGFSLDEVRTLILQGIRASWLSHEKKRQLIQRFKNDENWATTVQG